MSDELKTMTPTQKIHLRFTVALTLVGRSLSVDVGSPGLVTEVRSEKYDSRRDCTRKPKIRRRHRETAGAFGSGEESPSARIAQGLEHEQTS